MKNLWKEIDAERAPQAAAEADLGENSVESGEANRSLEIYRQGVEAAPTGLIMVNREGEIAMVNRQLENMFGYDRSELLGKSVEILVPERYRPEHPPMRKAYARNPVSRSMGQGRDLYGVRRDGTEFPIEIGLNPASDGEDQTVLASIVDVSSRKAQEGELQKRLEELQRYRTEMGLLSEMSSLLQHAVDHTEAYQIVSSFGKRLLSVTTEINAVAVYTARASGDALEHRTHWGSEVVDRFRPEDCWALRRSQSHYVQETENSPMLPRCSHVEVGGWQLCVPMSAHGQSIGIVSLSGKGTPSKVERVGFERVARAMADQLALAINNLNLRESLRSLAIRDPLTGLFNRRHMEESVTREISRVNRSGSKLSAMMIDIDHFKHYNDTHGHQAADEALIYLGKCLQEHFREMDIVCRYGGEEFLVVLPDCKKEEALSHAESLCQAVSKGAVGITVSIGIAEYPSDGHAWDMVLRHADTALYQAKTKGRNRALVGESR
ncbi:MAG: diguanylate cyclase [Burkholderiales bacterium]|nr:diguanylate cyclase [Burkholderiales bacterium]